ncbi:nuclear protein localization protein 4 [Echinococcus multilocularis]|uniref:Nuclear protein localization protein 4 n=1 Tax=Echinococcus multilocularis TaxID=6211 RepID=A0A068YNU7_ECHMU|nr:nuclear protein localization protein 4 [Echinococcus multilocularis]
MIIRVQSEHGTKRLEVSESDPVAKLFELTAKAFSLGPSSNWQLSKSRKCGDAIKRNTRLTLKTAKFQNGDILYIISKPKTPSSQAPSQTKDNDTKEVPLVPLKEDEVDKIIDAMDGKIKRPKGHLCHHPDSGVCIHCVPLEPSDPNYLSLCDPPVKFMSFHAYLRKLRGGQSKGKLVRLENMRCSLRPGCTSHPPWPAGICTQCQPSPVTLEVQPYRHVDYVQFENGEVVETFLDFWRLTGRQRIGLLLGEYAPFDTAGAPPLAIKAVVAAIYEPPQEATSRSVKLTCPLDQLMPPAAMATAEALGLRPVGWIFTDLTAEGADGLVKHYRGDMDTFFMSAEECITAARLQNLHPNPSRDSPDGHFGSKFVTVVVTGGTDNEIHFEAYQVSNVAMALESAGILVPTFDAPELGYIRESTKDRYVPDVFYSTKDKYGNTVTKIGRPLPVEYLLVDMPAAFPVEQTFTFAEQSTYHISPHDKFPVENREYLGQKQSVEAFARQFAAYGRDRLYGCLNNFHVLAWLAEQVDRLPLDQSSFNSLLATLRAAKSVTEWADNCPAWGSLDLILKTLGAGGATPSSPMDTSSSSGGGTHRVTQTSAASFRDVVVGTALTSSSVTATSSVSDVEGESSDAFWACQHCTFHNGLDRNECEICGLPRHAS